MAESVYTKELLKELQSMSLFEKIEMTKDRIEDWYMTYHGNVFVSFSGGKDSTVLLHLVRSMYPDVPAVFSDTGLEYPELKAFVREHDNVTVVRPKMTFSEVITKYGYPLVSKEVAEAIYYARRILPEDKPGAEVEREREARNKRAEMLGLRSKDSSRTTEPSWHPHNGAERLERERTVLRKQKELLGQRRDERIRRQREDVRTYLERDPNGTAERSCVVETCQLHRGGSESRQLYGKCSQGDIRARNREHREMEPQPG